MDAASNNSVEDIRSIREEVNFLPTKAKYRVYIIDEVHMLSTGAFNALLKTLEEPPEHVKFILATTEPQKLPATILSRCQRFDFKRISNEDIIKRLKIVCRESDIEITEGAMQIIAVLSEGAMRDALSILERCIQDGENKIDEDKIKDLVGIPKITYIHDLTEAIIQYDVEKALASIDEVLNEGKDIVNLLWELIKYVKDILVYQSSGKLDLYSKQELQNIKELSEKVSKQRLIAIIYELSELENNIKWSTQKVIMFQAGIIKLCYEITENTSKINVTPENIGNNKVLEERVQKIEQYLRNMKTTNAVNQNVTNQNVGALPNTAVRVAGNPSSSSNRTVTNSKSKTAQAKNFSNKVEEYWPQIITDLKQSGKIVLYTNLINTRAVELNDMTVGIQFPNGLTSFGKTVLEKQENIREISKLVSIACGKEMQIKYISEMQPVVQKTQEEDLQNLAEQSGIPFQVIE